MGKIRREYEENTKGIRRQHPSIALASRRNGATITLAARLLAASGSRALAWRRAKIEAGLPDAWLRRLESEARLRRVTKSHLVRTSVEKALGEGKEGAKVSCYDLARDLAGKVKGLPRDLAINPAYLKGFGQ